MEIIISRENFREKYGNETYKGFFEEMSKLLDNESESRHLLEDNFKYNAKKVAYFILANFSKNRYVDKQFKLQIEGVDLYQVMVATKGDDLYWRDIIIQLAFAMQEGRMIEAFNIVPIEKYLV